jgi:hypothetical protein
MRRTRSAASAPGIPAAGVQVGVAIDDQQAQPAQAVQDRVQRREFAQVELSWLIGRYAGDYGGAFGQDVREGSIGGQDGCRPGTAGPQVVHVDCDAHAELRKPGGFHISMMPGPVPGRLRKRCLTLGGKTTPLASCS